MKTSTSFSQAGGQYPTIIVIDIITAIRVGKSLIMTTRDLWHRDFQRVVPELVPVAHLVYFWVMAR